MSVIHRIIESTEYSDEYKVGMLEIDRRLTIEQIQVLKESKDPSLAIAKKIKDLSVDVEEIDNFLNSHRGLDGMTPIQP